MPSCPATPAAPAAGNGLSFGLNVLTCTHCGAWHTDRSWDTVCMCWVYPCNGLTVTNVTQWGNDAMRKQREQGRNWQKTSAAFSSSLYVFSLSIVKTRYSGVAGS